MSSSLGYLTGAAIKRLLAAGVTQVWYGVSTTPAHRGDLVSAYFLNRDNHELAHQTQLSGEFGNPEVNMLSRSWGGVIQDGYQRSTRWNAFLAEEVMLIDNHVYRVV